jgi:hypothetical protein
VSESGNVRIGLDHDTAAVLLDWLDREARIDDFKWAAARPGDRVALRRLHEAIRQSAPSAQDAPAARSRLEGELPPAGSPVPGVVLRRMPEHLRQLMMAGPPDSDLVGRLANRLDVLGVAHTGVGWRAEGVHGFVEVGLDPYSDEVANRIRLICDPVEVRFIRGPRRPRRPFPGYGTEDR